MARPEYILISAYTRLKYFQIGLEWTQYSESLVLISLESTIISFITKEQIGEAEYIPGKLTPELMR